MSETRRSPHGSELEYRQLFDTVPDALLLVDEERDSIVDCNVGATNMYGYSREEMLAIPWSELQADGEIDERDSAATPDRRLRPISHQRRKDGSVFPADISFGPVVLNDLRLLCQMIRDVSARIGTERKIDGLNQLKEALLQSGTIAEKLQRVTDEMVAHHDADFARIWMTSRGDRCDQGCIHAAVAEGPHICEHRDRCLHLVASSGRYPHLDGEVHRRVPFGCYKIGRVAAGKDEKFVTNDVTNDPRVHNHDWARELGLVSFAGYRLLSPQGTPIGVLALFSKKVIDHEHDAFLTSMAATTSQIIWATRTEEESNRLVTAMRQSDEGLIMTDADLAIQYANPALERITGFSREEVQGWNFKALLQDNVGTAGPIEIQEAINRSETWKGRLTGRCKDGSDYRVDTTVSPVRDEKGRFTNVVILMRDVSDLVQMEAQLRQSQKMEAIGTLAGGIAHDFNNMLYAILGYTELAADAIAPDSPVHECLRGIQAAGQRATSLVSQILAFSHPGNVEHAPLGLGAVVNDALDFMRNSLPATIDLRRDIDEDTGLVRADPTQIHQVIMNLCANAFHAMRNSYGALSVSLRKVPLSNEEAGPFLGLEAGEYTQLSIQDTGVGMSDDVKSRAFEPYFTTKRVGEGTGMGLATVHSIVASMGGAIFVESAVGEGTRFDIYFPLATEMGDRSEPEITARGHIQGNEHILLIDDEEAITRVGSMSLTRLGYRVTTYTDSREALAEFEANPEAYDIVVADLTMPNMSGDELAEHLLAVRAETPIVLCTGYSGSLSRERAMKIGIADYLEKPIEMRTLARVVRRILDMRVAKGA